MQSIKNYFFILLFCSALASKAQTNDTAIHIIDSLSTDTAKNKYGDLLHDDPFYNPKYAWWKPAVRVVSSNLFNWALARYVYKFDWPATSISDWKENFKQGPVWDVDGFGMNFIGHPHTGNYYFNVARANGYSFWGSLPYTLQGSLLWEFLGEKDPPSINDLINTPVSGAFLGEVAYRFSSNILDDRTRGGERVFREILAGVINPTRALNRLTQGKMFRVTTKEVYQKEPLNITISAGIHKVNDRLGKDNLFGTGSTNALLNMQFDYGDPFEMRKRKAFDFFRFRMELGYGDDKRLIDHVNGYGLLAGGTIKNNRLLGGLFQHYDFWRNNIFEVATLGLGGGLIARIPVSSRSNIFSTIHLAVVPLAGNNTEFGPDTSEFRQYNFGGGLQAKVEETFNLNQWATIGFTGFYYWMRTYNGLPGHSLVGIFKPTVSIRVFKNLRIGLEHHIYRNDRFLTKTGNLHLTRTEQKLFFQWIFEDSKRKGLYH